MVFNDVQKAASVALYNWITCTDKNVKRLMITHTDLDGWGCEVVVRSIMQMIHTDNLCFTSYTHSSPGHDNIVKRIDSWIDWASKNYIYKKGINVLNILITDLGNLNLAYFEILKKTGHKIQYTIVDHHLTDENVANFYQPIEDWHKVTECYYVNVNRCATYNLYKLIEMMISGYERLMSDNIYVRVFKSLNSALQKYCTDVDLYDRGMWGEWNVNKYEDVSSSCKEQFTFSTYMINSRSTYIKDRISMLHNINYLSSYYKKGIPRWKLAIEEYVNFNKSLEDYSESCPVDFIKEDDSKWKIMGLRQTNKNPISFYTIISKEYLTKNPDVDILFLITTRPSVELRSNKDSVNVGRIAYINGGGGHVRASGFRVVDNGDGTFKSISR